MGSLILAAIAFAVVFVGGAIGAHGTAEAVDWERSAPSEMITLNALRILQATRR